MQFKEKFLKIIKHPKYSYVVVFALVVIVFGVFQLQPNFGDPDVFYHVKLAKIMENQLVYRDFPWMQISSLKTNFTDHHFLFHLSLIPFLKLGGPMWGTKMAIVFWAASFVTVFYYFLRKFNFKYNWLTITALLLFSSFFFRLSLMKATPVSLIILLLMIIFIFEKKYWQLLMISYIFVLSYGGWLLGLFVALIYIFANTMYIIATKLPSIKNIFKEIIKKENIKLFSAIIGGNALGIIINPYFPQNLKFYWQQIVEIGIVNYGNIIQVGNEWYGTSPLTIITSTRFLFILLVIGLLLAIFNYKKINRQAVFFFSLATIFFILTMKSRRYLEYYGPFAAILAGYLLTLYYSDLQKWLKEIKQTKQNKPFYRSVFLIIIVLVVFMLIGQAKNTFTLLSKIPLTKFEQASFFLKNKTPYHSIVMHDNWDEWPMLFYHNTNSYYMAGLDPTFAYKYDKEKYLTWRKLVKKPADDNFYSTIKNDFQIDYVFAAKKYNQFIQNLNSNIYFEPVYEDEEVIIFKVL